MNDFCVLPLFTAGLAFLAFTAPCLLPAPLPEELAAPDNAASVQDTPKSRKPQTPLLFADLPSRSTHSSGSWFLSIGSGTGFPQYDDGELVNHRTGMVRPLGADASFAFTGLLSVGYRWFDPERWGHWSFDADFVGAYLGAGTSALEGRSQINLGFLGLRGRVGYRVAQDRFEPFIGFAGGGVIVNLAAISHKLSPTACKTGSSASLGLVFHPRSMSSYSSGGKPAPASHPSPFAAPRLRNL
ncbi:exported protein of unknown function [Methylacidimicrobium sp. AP8]|uniref:outer membrane protein n=1 Tax=Methylacidimicrobium sp. AP8 TaxID=2730359 RepID=UPI0018C115A9|nr:hypothetical protein [Methylacidimicrobium sp. AP8]CAB4243362.1 exported protein of unknown function [Methylacidimicrobium sp. AP8]